jgi:dGTPase
MFLGDSVNDFESNVATGGVPVVDAFGVPLTATGEVPMVIDPDAASGYSNRDVERFLTEDRRPDTRRGEFARDRARVLHSSALRRLGAKTQVLSPSTGDFARTRLTHSLEVAQIGREMAGDLGLDPDLVDMACLAHDLGHPPFGHNGELALNNWASEFGGFEGNAQTLRLLTRIEPKVFTTDGRSLGLNLTRASLDATIKYPWKRSRALVEGEVTQAPKFGFYADDQDIFDWVREGAPTKQKCVEAMVMDFADDVAYSVHDFEDAIVAGYVNLLELADPASEYNLLTKASEWSGGKYTALQLAEGLDRLRRMEHWPLLYSDTQAHHAGLKNLTSSLIGSFVSRTTEAAAAQGRVTRYSGVINVPEDVLLEIAVLKGVVAAFLMTHESRKPYYEYQRAILGELASALLSLNGRELDSFASAAWAKARTEEQEYRVIVDQVACLTDQSAIKLHHRLVTKGD